MTYQAETQSPKTDIGHVHEMQGVEGRASSRTPGMIGEAGTSAEATCRTEVTDRRLARGHKVQRACGGDDGH